MKKEVKIAIFAIVALAVAIIGYKYIRGFNVLSRTNTLFAKYERVDGLRISSPVFINGLQVGMVSDIQQEEANLNSIIVEMNLDRGIRVPSTTIAEIASSSLMGGTQVNLVFEGNCSGGECAQSGDTLRGITKGLLSSLATPAEIKLYMTEINRGLREALDTLGSRLSESAELKRSVDDVQVILVNLKTTTGRLDNLLAGSSGSIQGSLKNIEGITGNLKESNQQIKNILANAEALTTDLKAANISALTGEAKTTMQKLQATLASSDKAIADLGAVVADLKSGKGAIGMLTSDQEFAKSLEKTVKNFELLAQDIRLHPERYRRILSKKEMPYEAPVNDPGLKN